MTHRTALEAAERALERALPLLNMAAATVGPDDEPPFDGAKRALALVKAALAEKDEVRDTKGLDALVAWFNRDGVTLGNEGDLAGWFPCETALVGLKRLTARVKELEGALRNAEAAIRSSQYLYETEKDAPDA